MEIIDKKTTAADLKAFLSENGYECGEITDNSFVYSQSKLKATMMILPSGNILSMVHMFLKEGVEELTALRKINSTNFQITSGCLSLNIKDRLIAYSFTLIRPYGMGSKGFKNYIDYHMFLISYIMEELGLSEITK